MNLDGATALVTGANRGIGRALVERLAVRPLRLVLAGVRVPADFDPPVPRAGRAGAREVRAVRMDLASRESIEECCAELGDELGRIDVLVNNAGLMTGGLLEEQDMEAVYAMFQVNLVAVADLTSRVLPWMLGRGSGMVVNNASISAYAYLPAASTYAASKAGVVALTESLRRELRGTGVRALHLVTPGVATEMLQATEEVYGRHMDTSQWGSVPVEEWAERVLAAIEGDRRVLGPGGRLAALKLAAEGPAFMLDGLAQRMFSRRPRG
jgi:short-subunit dehydrogenase